MIINKSIFLQHLRMTAISGKMMDKICSSSVAIKEKKTNANVCWASLERYRLQCLIDVRFVGIRALSSIKICKINNFDKASRFNIKVKGLIYRSWKQKKRGLGKSERERESGWDWTRARMAAPRGYLYPRGDLWRPGASTLSPSMKPSSTKKKPPGASQSLAFSLFSSLILPSQIHPHKHATYRHIHPLPSLRFRSLVSKSVREKKVRKLRTRARVRDKNERDRVVVRRVKRQERVERRRRQRRQRKAAPKDPASQALNATKSR